MGVYLKVKGSMAAGHFMPSGRVSAIQHRTCGYFTSTRLSTIAE